MPQNHLGNFIRERRANLGLTQEELANRIGGSASQAEVSRLERGSVAFPRRSRLEALAAALEVSLGALLVNSGWMESDEVALVDDVLTRSQLEASPTQPPPASFASDTMLAEIRKLRDSLLTAIERIEGLEEQIKRMSTTVQRPDVTVPNGVDDDGKTSATYEA